ncbi:TlpA family protein disulfide reductase [Corynebacterium sp. CNCTC7651]|uniref:TlpA family protein disulfide reductase n=1 Tax=Corynebacterium sp. CNCTC7651 TaxID=2815361 RepID=UPI001F39F746|nr:TlpA disulfide reductase family protein [Corynebacterium sp. CNCTC7651]UIZ92391.1 TlpA family protein disulfide reductase [Corynebacterium sp. CNCTC7651]
MHRRTAALACAAIIAGPLAGSLAACGGGGDDAGTFAFHSPGGQVEIFYDEAERRPLPDFSGESLTEPGAEISLSDFAGQVVVELQAGGTGTVLGINVRDYNPDISRDFLADSGATYPSLYDPPFKTAAYLGGVPSSVIPTTVVLDNQHRPAAVFLREITADDILEVVDRLREEGNA